MYLCPARLFLQRPRTVLRRVCLHERHLHLPPGYPGLLGTASAGRLHGVHGNVLPNLTSSP
jgi:hypothetical protein